MISKHTAEATRQAKIQYSEWKTIRTSICGHFIKVDMN
jgi:hypothetical protein